MIIISAPNIPRDDFKVFLAGSIEMGKAEDWQARLARELNTFNVTLLNPRRADWDASWEPKASNPQFSQQVIWELNALERAHLIALYLSPGTMSPISLLEFGLYVRSGRLIVCCPEGFWRKGNVDITAARYGTPVYDDWAPFVKAIKGRLP